MPNKFDLYDQRLVVEDIIAPNKILLFSEQGSRRWGTERPNSDFDVRFVYAAPTIDIIGLSHNRDTIEGMRVIDNMELDYQGYEIKKCLTMLLNNNGTIHDLVANVSNIQYLDELANDLPSLAVMAASKKLAKHYLGYANGQYKDISRTRSAKTMLCVYREMLAGMYFFYYGEHAYSMYSLHDFMVDIGLFGISYNVDCLLWRDNSFLSESEISDFNNDWEVMSVTFDDILRNSVVKPEYDYDKVESEYNRFLIALRLRL